MINPFELSVVSNDAFREIFQSMTEGIIVVDKAGSILVANPIAEQMFGYDSHELTGLKIESLLPERYRGKHLSFREQFNSQPSPRRMGMGRDLAALKKTGTEFPVEISLSFSQVKDNFMAIAFITDISFRKHSEEALKQSEEQLMIYATELERKVEARTKDLHEALAKERELNELKSKFVSIASHEFRTPLSTILSSISLIDQYNKKGEPDKINKHTHRVRSSVNQLTGILNDFLSLGKLEEGKVEVSIEPVDLKILFEDIKEEVQLKEGQSIEIDIQNGTDGLQSDSRIIRNILLNLISNASKYSESGTITMRALTKDKSIEISITDQGIGIPEADVKHLFERFFRASNSGNIQGTGLGLNIVKRYVDLLKGSIWFTSEHKKGTTFFVSIPKHS